MNWGHITVKQTILWSKFEMILALVLIYDNAISVSSVNEIYRNNYWLELLVFNVTFNNSDHQSYWIINERSIIMNWWMKLSVWCRCLLSLTFLVGSGDRSHVMGIRVRVMVFNATFNTISVISWRSALSMREEYTSPEMDSNSQPLL